jgi:hypothetical protein
LNDLAAGGAPLRTLGLVDHVEGEGYVRTAPAESLLSQPAQNGA